VPVSFWRGRYVLGRYFAPDLGSVCESTGGGCGVLFLCVVLTVVVAPEIGETPQSVRVAAVVALSVHITPGDHVQRRRAKKHMGWPR
jgi:hypothetical protein